MITAADSDYHDSDPADWRWTETTPLIFSVPEHGILGNIYVASRPNLGVALSTVTIGQGFCRKPYEIDFSDAQMHLPAPKSFTDYTLENGLSVKVLKAPTEYQFTYEYKLGGTSFDLHFEGLHEPFDANDSAQNPMLNRTAGAVKDSRFGDEWGNSGEEQVKKGHYEIMGHITGELTLRGKSYEVDCYDVMDHSFGTRTETSKRAVSFISAVFGEDYGIHVAVPMEVRGDDTEYEGFRFGYVMENGELFGVVDARVESSSGTDMLPMNAHIVAEDVRGKKHVLYGAATAGHPWYNLNPSHVCFQSLMRWHLGDRVGYGEMCNIFGLEFLAARKSRHGELR